MMKATLILISILLLACSQAQELNPPEFKFSVSYDLIEALQKQVLEPFLKSQIRNLSISQTIPFKKGPVHGEVSNVKINNFDLDWEGSRILTINKAEKPTTLLKNISLEIQFDAKAAALKLFHLKSKGNIVYVSGFDIELVFGFGAYPNGTAYAYIDSANVQLDKLDIHFNQTLMKILLKIAKFFKFKPEDLAAETIQSTILGFNHTLIEKSTEGASLLYLDFLQIGLTLADIPHVFDLGNKAFQAVPVNIDVLNTKTHMSALDADFDIMPDFIDQNMPVQFFVSNTMIGQFLWLAFQSGKIDLVYSALNLPKFFPLQLNTTNMQTVFPNLTAEYGRNKGVYMEITKGGDYPLAFIRDGRLVGDFALSIDFWVDTDGSQYPSQGLKNCTTCEHAISLNTSIFASALIYQENSQTIMTQIQNLIVHQVGVEKGNVDSAALQDLLNNMIGSTISAINLQMKDGIANPFIGLLGISSTSLILETDYLFFGLDFKGNHKIHF